MARVRYVPEALSELIEAARRYDDRRRGLGDRFIGEVEREIGVVAGGGTYGPWRDAVRFGRVPVAVFRFYALAVLPVGETLWVLAVVHQRRRPLYWITRRPP